MQTHIFNSKTSTNEERRAAVDKYLETAGFVSEVSRLIIYYILERPYLYEDLEQFAQHEATRAAFPCYVFYWEGRKVCKYLDDVCPSIRYSLTDPVVHGYIRDAARHLFEMINAGHNDPAPTCQSNTNN